MDLMNIKDVEKIARYILRAEGAHTRTAQVATISGDATVWYSVTLYLDNDTTHATAPVRCYRHYSPVVGDRVDVLWQNNQPWRVMGKTN